jgi:HAE1 family hydrophobic/amphiphilic exporter-1
MQLDRGQSRPLAAILMTLSRSCGMLPIALGRGSGAGSRASMAITIIGGQMLCLLLTLLVTPVVYSYFDDLREWRSSRVISWVRGELRKLRLGRAEVARSFRRRLGAMVPKINHKSGM